MKNFIFIYILFISLFLYGYALNNETTIVEDGEEYKENAKIKVEEVEEDEEIVFSGRIIKYLNITDIPEEGNDEIAEISATKKVFNETFYNQLNSAEKDVYDCLYENSNKEKPEIQFQVVIEKYIDKQKVNMERVMTSLVFDNPQFWWIESYSITLKNSYKDISELEVMRITILTVDFMTKDSQLQLTRDEIDFLKSQIVISREPDSVMSQFVTSPKIKGAVPKVWGSPF